MWLKPVIVILFLAVLLSLSTSLTFLLRDQGSTDRARKWLGIRVSLALLLLACVVYGLWSGQLTISAPWHPS